MGMIDKTVTNPLIKKTMQRVEAAVKPDQQDAFLRIVTAGLKFAFDKKSHNSVIEGLDKSTDPVKDVATGTVGLLLLMHQQSGGTMPVPPMVLAGMILVLHGLDYIEQARGVKIGNTEIDNATQMFIQTIAPKVGLTADKMKEATDNAHRAMQDPALMAKFKEAR